MNALLCPKAKAMCLTQLLENDELMNSNYPKYRAIVLL